MRRSVLVAGIALGTAAPAAPDLPDIRETGVLRVLVSSDEMAEMFSFSDEGHPGLEREMIEAFARSQRLSLEVVQVENFETIIPALLAGRGDLITGIIDTPARRREVAFTVETLPARHVAVNRAPRPRVSGQDELATLRVAVVTGTSWEEAAVAAGVPEEGRLGYSTVQDALGALREETAEAMVMSLPDFAHAQRADPALQAGSFVGAAASAAWAVRPGDVELRRALDDHIQSLRRSPSWSALVLRYFSEDALRLVGQSRR